MQIVQGECHESNGGGRRLGDLVPLTVAPDAAAAPGRKNLEGQKR